MEKKEGRNNKDIETYCIQGLILELEGIEVTKQVKKAIIRIDGVKGIIFQKTIPKNRDVRLIIKTEVNQ